MMKNNGFTLLETILVIALILALGSAATAFSSGFYRRMAVEHAASELVSVIVSARESAKAGKLGSDWGVWITESTIFAGDSYDGRDTADDVRFSISETVEVGSDFDGVVFVAGSGLPRNTLSVQLTSGEALRTVSVNSEGLVFSR